MTIIIHGTTVCAGENSSYVVNECKTQTKNISSVAEVNELLMKSKAFLKSAENKLLPKLFSSMYCSRLVINK